MARIVVILLLCVSAPAQTPLPTTALSFGGTLARDQRAILTSPARIAHRDWKWILPAAGGFAYLLATDERNMRDRLDSNGPARDRSLAFSNAGTAALAGLPVYLYWRGWRHADGDGRATGILAARAVADTLLAAGVVRLATERERPGQNDGSGRFLQGGSAAGSGFPSLHSAAAWSIASVVARRYPGWLTKIGVYGIALGVSASRITSREHFPSDVMAGSLMGLLVGRYVARDPHPEPAAPHAARPVRTHTASAYVPLESWIYLALDRLAALGLIPSQTSGLRPWTRAECRRQMIEAGENAGNAEAEPADLLRELHAELDRDANAAAAISVDSVYARGGVIAGRMLNDSLHFGQTWANDQGRPFGRGFNSYVGFTAHGESGRFFGAVQAEYQRAPGADPYPLPVRQTIAQLDGIPLPDATAAGVTSRFRAIEAYAGVRIGDLQFSAGKQALWWGPTSDSPLSFGSNAEPTKNLKISTVHPVHMGRIGVRGEFVLGKLGGHSHTWRPWFNAQKLSFQLTGNLEMGFTRWSIFWGVGHPITVGSFIRNFTSLSSPEGPAGIGRSDPGDRKGGFDFRYRIPGLRNWLTLYSDSYSDDDPSPLAAPRRAAINPGLYVARVPGLPRLDLRLEAPSTQPMGLDDGGGFVYFNNQYRSGNTNYGNLLGNPVGRDGRALQVSSTWWFSARSKLQAGYRQQKGSAQFLPGGSTQSDITLKGSARLARDWFAAAGMQYERFRVPVLGGPGRNLSAWAQLTWEPDLKLSR